MPDKSNKPESVDLTVEEVNALKQRLQANSLTEDDRELLSGVLSFTLWLQHQISIAKMSIKNLRKLFGFKTEKKSKKKVSEDDVTSTQDDAANGVPEALANAEALILALPTEEKSDDSEKSQTNAEAKIPLKPNWDKDANHGRYGFDDYEGLETIVIQHETLKSGDMCPDCELGKIYRFEAGRFIRLEGSPMVNGKRYQLEGLRCNLCLMVFKPTVPETIKQAPKFSHSALSTIAIGHYYYGQPFHRIEHWQRNCSVPLPDSTQYDEMAKFSLKVKPIVQCLEYLSANATLMHYDDTPMKILADAGGQGTAVVSQNGEHLIYLFYVSHRVAGKEVSGLLQLRETTSPLITMTDALRHNELTDVDEALLSKLIVSFCLAHGRRKFFDLLEDFPAECKAVVDCIAEVYGHDAHCKAMKLSPCERLKYHQAHSAEVMAALKTYLSNLWQYEGVEHNSTLGDAVQYMLKRWSGLTRFLTVEGCPLDNTLCERAIKVLIRYRKNSMFYRTVKGALCGNTLMSLIHTAMQNNINAFDYLNAIQEYQDLVQTNPEAFLPWNYQATLEQLEEQADKHAA